MKKLFPVIFILINSFTISSCYKVEDSNSRLEYSDDFPSNCRALIKSNIDGFNNYKYSAYEVLNSINRNCGEKGSLWIESIGVEQAETNPFAQTLLRNDQELLENEMDEIIEYYENKIGNLNITIINLQNQINTLNQELNNSKSTELIPQDGIIVENTNFRKFASINGEKIRILEKGELVSVFPESIISRDGYQWIIIKDKNSIFGWAVIDGIRVR